MYAKKNSGRKLVLLLLAVALLMGCAVGGTVAWLATQTDPIQNTFTVGDIQITLEEPSFNEDEPYKILPGGFVAKDPTVTVLAGSEKCYVRMFMAVRYSEKADGHFSGRDTVGWIQFNDQSGWDTTLTLIDEQPNDARGHVFELTYGTVVDAAQEDVVLPSPMVGIQLPGTLTGAYYSDLDGCTITVIAQAVQADGFNTAAEAFAEAGLPDAVVVDGMTIAQLMALHASQDPATP